MEALVTHKLTPADSARHARFFTLLRNEFAEIPWLTEDAAAEGEAYALLKDGELVGGITLFESAPETPDIRKEADLRLNGRPATFASCFTVAEEYRKKGYGLFLAEEVFENEVFTKGKIAWGVFQKPALTDFYKKHFACELYPLPDNLYLIIFTAVTAKLTP